MVGGGDGWQKLMGPMDGSGGWLGEKNSKKIVPNELMSPKKQHVFFCFYPYFFNPSLRRYFTIYFGHFMLGV